MRDYSWLKNQNEILRCLVEHHKKACAGPNISRIRKGQTNPKNIFSAQCAEHMLSNTKFNLMDHKFKNFELLEYNRDKK